MIYRGLIKLNTKADQFYDVTKKISDVVTQSGIQDGLCSVFVKATTAALLVNENNRMLIEDFRQLLADLAPKGKIYQHPENGHAHLRSTLLNNGLTIPIANNEIFIGEKQNVLLFEFDGKDREREVVVTVYGP